MCNPSFLTKKSNENYLLFYLSTSSKMIILCFPGGSVTFCCANILTLFLTISIPLSLEALSSRTASLKAGPSNILAKQRIVVVLPTPGGPYKKKWYLIPILLFSGICYGYIFS